MADYEPTMHFSMTSATSSLTTPPSSHQPAGTDMNMTRLLRTLFTSVLALVLTGGLMAAQAQDAERVVDQDGSAQGTDFQNIPDALNALESATGSGSGDTGTLIIYAGDYRTAPNNNGEVDFSRTNLPNLDVEVREDDVSGGGATQLTLEQFAITNGTDVTAINGGSGTIRLTASGVTELNLDDGDLTVETGMDIDVQGSGVADVFRTANSDVSGGGSISFGQGDLEYDLSNGDIDASLEAPPNLFGDLTVSGASGNTLTFPNDFEFNDFTYNGGNITAEGNFTTSTSGGFTVPSGSQLLVANELGLSATTPTLTVNGTAGTSSNPIGTLDVPDWTSSSTAGGSPDIADQNVLEGDGTVNITTFTIGGTDGFGGYDLYQARVQSSASSFDVTIDEVQRPVASDGDLVEVDIGFGSSGGTFSVGGEIGNISTDDPNANGTVTGTTITSKIVVGAGSLTFTGNTTYRFEDDNTNQPDVATAVGAGNAAIDNTGSGSITIQNNVLLTVSASNNTNGNSRTLIDNGPNGITGDGTISLAGDSGDDFTITTTTGNDQILPNVLSDRQTLIQDDTGNPTDIETGNLRLGEGTAGPSRLGDGAVNNVTTGNVRVSEAVGGGSGGLIIGDGGNTVGNVEMGDVEVFSSLDIGQSGTVGTVTLASLTTQDDVTFSSGNVGLVTVSGETVLTGGSGHTVDFTGANNTSTGGTFDVSFQGNVTINSAGPNIPAELNLSGRTVEMKGDFTRAPNPQAELTTTDGTELRFTSIGAGIQQEFDIGSSITIEGVFNVATNEATVEVPEAFRMSGDIEIQAPGSPSAPNNKLLLRDNIFMTESGSRLLVDSDLITEQTAQGTESFVIFEGDGGNRTFDIERESSTITPEIGNFRLRDDADVDITSTTGLDFSLAFRGIVDLVFGDLTVDNAGNVSGDFSAAASGDPEIRRRLDNATDTELNTGQSNDTFNSAGNTFNLTYRGDNDSTPDTGTETEEFPQGGEVADLIVERDAQLELTESKTTSGDLTVTVRGIIRTDGNGDRSLILSASNGSHSVQGAVSGFDTGDVLTTRITGQGATLTGDPSISSFAILQTLSVDASDVTVTDIHQIAKDINIAAGQGLDLSLAVPDPTQNLGDGKVYGAIDIAGNGSLTLSSDIDVSPNSADDNVFDSANDHNSETSNVNVASNGSITFGNFDLTVNQGSFAGQTGASYSTSGGGLVMSSTSGGPSTFGTFGEDIRRVRFEEPTALSSNARANVQTTVNDELDSNTFDYFFEGNVALNVSSAFTGTGELIATGSTVTLGTSGSVSVSNFTVDHSGSGTTTTIDKASSGIGPDLEVMGTLRLLNGTLAYNVGVELTGSTAGADELIADGGTIELGSNFTSASQPFIAFNGGSDFSLGLSQPLTLPNLQVVDAAQLQSQNSNGEENLQIENEFQLINTFSASGSSGSIVIADGGEILRGRGGVGIHQFGSQSAIEEGDNVLDEPLQFEGTYDLEYFSTGGEEYVSSYEVTTDPSILGELEIDVSGGGDVYLGTSQLTGPVTLNSLILQEGNLDYARRVVVRDNGRVTRTESAGLNDVTDKTPGDSDTSVPDPIQAAGTYSLRYVGSSDIDATGREFIDDGGTGIADVRTRMTSSTGTTTLSIDFNVTARSLTVNNGSSGITDISGADLTVDNAATLNSGETRLTSGSGSESTVEVAGKTEVNSGATLTIGSVWTANGNASVSGTVVGDYLDANAKLTLDDATLATSSGGSSNEAVIELAGTLEANESSAGALTTRDGSSGNGMDLTLDGSSDQTLNLTGLESSLELGPTSDGYGLTLDQGFSGTVRKATLDGADIDLTTNTNSNNSNGIELDSGVLVNDGDETVVLPESGVDGVDRDPALAGFGSSDNESHVAAPVQRELIDTGTPGTAQRVVFPVGSANTEYREYRLDLESNTLVRSENVTVEFFASSPGGTGGLPFKDDTGVVIGENYPPYYWRVEAEADLTLQRPYEVAAQGYLDDTNVKESEVTDHRLIRRNNQTNADWTLVGSASEYDNDSDQNTRLARFRTADASASITQIGRLFTVGVPAGDMPQIAANAGLTLTQSQSANITTSELEVVDGDNTASELTYTLTGAPSQGDLVLSGTVLSQGATFTQADIDNGDLSYDHTASNANDDSFDFEAADPDGQTAGGTFDITVNPAQVSISGQLSYPAENSGPTFVADGTALGGETVVLFDDSGNQLATTTTNSNGEFSFTGQDPNMSYEIEANISSSPAELSIADAQRIVDHRVTTPAFANASFQEEIADVNDQGGVTSLDALEVALFVVQSKTSWQNVPNWFTPMTTVNAGTSSETGVQVTAAEYGDANLSGGSSAGPIASNFEATASSESASATAKSTTVKQGETFEVPVRLDGEATLGAYEFALGFDTEKASFEGAAVSTGKVLTHTTDGTVRIGWLDQTGRTPMELSSGDRLVTLRFKASKQVDRGTGFGLDFQDGEAVSASGTSLGKVGISVPSFTLGEERPDSFALKGNYPNPTSGMTQLKMDLPKATMVTVSVYNALGQRVQRLEQDLTAGSGQTLQLNSTDLPSGQYFYRIKAEFGSKTVRETGRMTVVR